MLNLMLNHRDTDHLRPKMSHISLKSDIIENKMSIFCVTYYFVQRRCSNKGAMYYLELLRPSEGTLSRWSCLYLQLLAPDPH
jgi:hypothetical protein